jgi:hypothetical protein
MQHVIPYALPYEPRVMVGMFSQRHSGSVRLCGHIRSVSSSLNRCYIQCCVVTVLAAIMTIKFFEGLVPLTELKMNLGRVVKYVSGAVDRIMGQALPQ